VGGEGGDGGDGGNCGFRHDLTSLLVQDGFEELQRGDRGSSQMSADNGVTMIERE
jgi:hypothetical protein